MTTKSIVANDDLHQASTFVARAAVAAPITNLSTGDGSFSQSDAFSRPSFLRGSVDPRTGSFNYTIPIASVVGNRRMGPGLEISLRYDHFSQRNEGFGKGWVMSLGRLDYGDDAKQYMTIKLRDGRNIRYMLDSSTQKYVQQTVGPYDFKVTQTGSATDEFVVAYKNGDSERIQPTGPNGNFMLVREIIHENGYKLALDYDVSVVSTNSPRLQRIYDGLGTSLIDIRSQGTPDNYTVYIDVNKGDAEFASTLTLKVVANRLTSVQTTYQTQKIDLFAFTYRMASGLMVISDVTSSYSGPANESITYLDAGLKAPPGAPWSAVPAVQSYTLSIVSPASGMTHTEKQDFSFVGDGTSANNNFLGFGGVTTWDPNAIDNLYTCPASYTYQSSQTVTLDGTIIGTTLRIYDVYHRLTSEAFTPLSSDPEQSQSVLKTFTYPGSTSTAYSALPRQFALPSKLNTDYTWSYGDTSRIRTTTLYTTYDDFGNLTRQQEVGGMTTNYYYYPAAGVAEKCPVEPNGFIRFLQAAEQYQNDPGIDSVEKTYTYTSTRFRENAAHTVVQSYLERRVESSVWRSDSHGYRYEYFPYTTDADADAGNGGKLKSETSSISDATASTRSFAYAYSTDGRQVTTTTITSGPQGSSLTSSKTVSTLIGVPVRIVDNVNVETTCTYDNFGRTLSVTNAAGSSYESTTTYAYGYDTTSRQHSKTTSAPARYDEIEIFDALGNVGVRKINGMIAETFDTDTAGRLISTHRYDYDVKKADGTTGGTDRSTTYTYDAFGNVTTTADNTGIVRYSTFNIATAQTTEYVMVSGRTNRYANVDTEHDSRTLKPSVAYFYASDSKTLLSSARYTYDTFERLRSIALQDAESPTARYVYLTYDGTDRVVTRQQADDTGQTRETSWTFWPYGLDDIPTSVSVDATVIATQQYDDLGRLVEQDRNPATPGVATTTLAYQPGYLSPDTRTSPRGIAIRYAYIPELGCKPSSVTPSDNSEVFAYEYDKDLQMPIRETNTTDGTSRIRSISYNKNALPYKEIFSNSDGTTEAPQYTNAYTRSSLGTQLRMTRSMPSSVDHTISNTYDAQGRLDTITFDRTGFVECKTSIVYLGGELPASIDYTFYAADGSSTQFNLSIGYDDKLRPVSKIWSDQAGVQIASTITAFDFLDRASTQKTSTIPNQLSSIVNQFDAFDRLVKATWQSESTVLPKDRRGTPLKSYEYVFDKFDNITQTLATSESSSTYSTDFAFTGKNLFEMTGVTQTEDSTVTRSVLTYDDSGNLITNTTNGVATHYFYDAYEKLQSTGATPDSVAFTRNGAGLLDTETVGGATPANHTQLYSLGELVAVRDTSASDDALTTLIRGLFGAEATDTSRPDGTGSYTNAQALLMTNAIGSVFAQREPAASSGSALQQIVYSPYGDLNDAQAAGLQSMIRFIGARLDTATGLYHLGEGNRAYDSLLMRFQQYDASSPFGKGGINPYIYCGGDPATYVDPTGQGRELAITLAVIGFLLAVFLGGLGVAAAIGAASKLTIGLAITAAVLDITAGALGVAAASVANDHPAKDDLEIAALSIGSIGAVMSVASIGRALWDGKMWRVVRQLSKARAFKANMQTVDPYPGASLRIGRTVRNGETITFVKTHGNVGRMARPVPNPRYTGLDDVKAYMDEVGTVEEFAEIVQSVSPRYFSDNTGSIFLGVCGGTRAGAQSNAQTLANVLGRNVHYFPSKTTFTDIMTGGQGRVAATGVPFFPREAVAMPT